MDDSTDWRFAGFQNQLKKSILDPTSAALVQQPLQVSFPALASPTEPFSTGMANTQMNLETRQQQQDHNWRFADFKDTSGAYNQIVSRPNPELVRKYGWNGGN